MLRTTSRQGRPSYLEIVREPARPVELLGVALDPLREGEALSVIETFVASGARHQVVTVNLDFLRLARRSPEFRRVLNRADLALADGMPLVWASKLTSSPLPQRVAGVDLVELLCRRGGELGWSVYLLGSAPGVAQAASAEMLRRYPGLRIAGVYSPPHGAWDDLEEQRIRDRICDAHPDVLLVALGAPRQDLWIHDNLGRLAVPVSIGVGCTFDVLCGVSGRAPPWMRRLGLEWLYRLTRDPGRLWKRYLLHDLPTFWRLIFSAALSRRGAQAALPDAGAKHGGRR